MSRDCCSSLLGTVRSPVLLYSSLPTPEVVCLDLLLASWVTFWHLRHGWQNVFYSHSSGKTAMSGKTAIVPRQLCRSCVCWRVGTGRSTLGFMLCHEIGRSAVDVKGASTWQPDNQAETIARSSLCEEGNGAQYILVSAYHIIRTHVYTRFCLFLCMHAAFTSWVFAISIPTP